MTRYAGVDLHRRRSVIVVLDGDGSELWTHRIDNDPLTLGLEIEKAGPAPEVVLEATWGWYWAADVISEAGGAVHLAHPLGIAGFENRRVKNDQIDARLLADLLRMGRLPEAWIAPGSIRQQRQLVRYRRKLSQLRAGLKAQVHSVSGKEGQLPPINHLWGPGGKVWLDETDMGEAYETRSGRCAASSRPTTANWSNWTPISGWCSKATPAMRPSNSYTGSVRCSPPIHR